MQAKAAPVIYDTKMASDFLQFKKVYGLLLGWVSFPTTGARREGVFQNQCPCRVVDAIVHSHHGHWWLLSYMLRWVSYMNHYCYHAFDHALYMYG